MDVIAGRIAALISAALFALVCLRLARRALTAPALPAGAPEAPSEKEERGVRAGVFLALLALDGAALLFVYLLRMGTDGVTDLRDSLSVWTRVDSQHYLAIARDWYLSEGSMDRLVQLVFLPGYPLAVRAVHPLLGDWLAAGFLVSALSFAGAGTLLYRLARLDMDRETSLRAIRYLCLAPGAFFFAAPMSESLYLLLSAACMLLLRKKRWLPACVLGGLAAFTRSLGLTLLVPAAWELLTDIANDGSGHSPGRVVLRALPLLLIPAGFGVYCLICRSVSGSAFQWMVYQREHWHQQLGLFFSTAAYQTENALSALRTGDFHLLFGLWLPNLSLSFAALAVMGLALPALRPS